DYNARGSELGRALARQLKGAKDAPGPAFINIANQAPNTLLHDGRAWKAHSPARLLGDTLKALAQPSREKAFFVHASYAFLRAAEAGGKVGDTLEGIVEAALAAEQAVLSSGRPACVVRLGYLYGPTSEDLKAYELAFSIGRPYWAGPRRNLQHHLHVADAASALLTTATARPAGEVLYAADAHPASFSSFMDHFARRIGNPVPLHIPRIGGLMAQFVVKREHQQMTALAVHGPATPQVPGWKPAFADYRAGIADVLAAWEKD
ncbi:MAG: hypothetical protein QOE92_1239, partial [Chloroflexota bacterium]|nr:hypothetical protein [Chloroflexota bacterium]